MRPQPAYTLLRYLVFPFFLALGLLRAAGRTVYHRVSTMLHRAEAAVSPVSQRPLLCFGTGLLSGNLCSTAMSLSPALMGSLVLAGGLLTYRWGSPQVQRCCRLFFVGIILTHLHVLWQMQALPREHIVHVLSTQSTRPRTVEGTLARAVEPRGDRQRLYLRLDRLQGEQGWQPSTGLVRLNVHTSTLPFLPGDVVRIERLRLHRVRGFLNPGGFNFARFMRRQRIYAVGGVSKPTRVSLQHRPTGFLLARTIERWRRLLRAKVRTHLPAPSDAVFLGMVLGQRGLIPSTMQEHFRIAGAAHLLVVSGLHVGFIAAGCLFGWRGLLRWGRSMLPRAWLPGWRPTPIAALLSLPPLLVYCTLVGWKVPTTRAALMIGSYMLALVFSRPRQGLHALILAASVIVLLDPTAVFAVGFQLSFAAVACMLLVTRKLRYPQSTATTSRRWGQRLQTYVLVSSAAYFGALPIVAATFRTVPTYGIVANLLLVPLAGILVPMGVVALAMLALWPALGALVFLPVTPLLSWVVTIVATIASLPTAQMHFASPSVPMLLGYYGLLGSLCLQLPQRYSLSLAACGLTLLLVGTSWQYLGTRTPHLRVTFLDVGTGDAIFVQSPDNHYLLIDGGGTYDGRFDIGAQVIAPFLWDRYVPRFDLIAMTHPQTNHARGLVSLMRMFPTKSLLTNGTPLTANYLRDLLAAGRRWGTRHHTALDGPRHWRWGDVHLTVLAPPAVAEQQRVIWTPPTENDRSLVLRLQYGAVRILLTGDIQRTTERWLLAHGADLRADIMQVPHHGSKTSTLPAFVRQVRPQVGIISLGAGNAYGHPHPRVLRVLHKQQIQVFRTDYHGAITITSDGAQYQILPFRPYVPPPPAARLSPK